jgi:tetratricopeptide (TPR) repeat protein
MLSLMLLGLLLLSVTNGTCADYVIRCVERAPIVVDGKIDDWEKLEAEYQSVESISTRFQRPSSTQDISAKFQVLADFENLFIVFIVVDDEVIFGRESFSKTWRQDCVEVYFDGDLVNVQKDDYDSNDGQIRVSSEDGDSAQLEGAVKVGDNILQLPLLWNALGVTAALKRTSRGYVVELQVPTHVFGKSWFSSGEKVGLNVKVIDVDSNNTLKVLSWQGDANSTSWLSTRNIAEVVMEGSVYQNRAAEIQQDINNQLILTIPSEPIPTIQRALTYIAENNRETVKPLLADIAQNSKRPESRAWALYILYSLVSSSDKERIHYIDLFLRENPQELGLHDWVAANTLVTLANCYWALGMEENAFDVLVDAYQQIRKEHIGGLYAIGEVLTLFERESKTPRRDISSLVVEYSNEFEKRCHIAIESGGKRAYVGNVLFGWYLETRSNYSEAIKHFLVCIEYDPKDPDPYLYIARCNMKMKAYNEAIEYYQKALESPVLAKVHVEEATMGLSTSLAAIGRYDRAVMVVREKMDKMSKEGQVVAEMQLQNILQRHKE